MLWARVDLPIGMGRAAWLYRCHIRPATIDILLFCIAQWLTVELLPRDAASNPPRRGTDMLKTCQLIGAAALLPTTLSLPSVAAAQPAQASEGLREYRINPGDELEIYVWGEERLQRSVKVLPDGSFAFPLVGQIKALNKLPSEIEAAISAGLRQQYREQVPQVTVSVKNPAGLQFVVAGKVRSPGAFTPGRYVNILEAVSMAGGPSEFANLSDVAIIRKRNGRLSVIKVRLTDFLRGSPNNTDLQGLPQLESGDSVVVP
jgi:polysaccharide export outer membrane protein